MPSFHEIGAARQQLVVAHPDEMRGELIGDLGPVLRVAQDIAARDIEFVGEGQGDGIARRSAVEVAVAGDDARDLRVTAGTRDDDLVAGLDAFRSRRFRENPRKSRCGRLTHCTAKRNGWPQLSSSTSIVSR